MVASKLPVVRAPVPASPVADGVTAADMLGDEHGCHGLHQRRLTLSSGASLAGTAAPNGEAWYVIAGDGGVSAGPDQSAPLRPGTAVWLPAGSAYRCAADAGLELLAVTVRAGSPASPALRAVTLDECLPERTGDREFRVLLSEGLTITAFAGRIPPGRAPEHQHTYDEVVHVLAGHGVVHLAAASGPAGTEIGPGTSIYLPPGQPHCLENTGTETLEVLGVFHPAGSPAAKGGT